MLGFQGLDLRLRGFVFDHRLRRGQAGPGQQLGPGGARQGAELQDLRLQALEALARQPARQLEQAGIEGRVVAQQVAEQIGPGRAQAARQLSQGAPADAVGGDHQEHGPHLRGQHQALHPVQGGGGHQHKVRPGLEPCQRLRQAVGREQGEVLLRAVAVDGEPGEPGRGPGHGGLRAPFLRPEEAGGGGAVGVGVHQDHAPARSRQDGGQVGGREAGLAGGMRAGDQQSAQRGGAVGEEQPGRQHTVAAGGRGVRGAHDHQGGGAALQVEGRGGRFAQHRRAAGRGQVLGALDLIRPGFEGEDDHQAEDEPGQRAEQDVELPLGRGRRGALRPFDHLGLVGHRLLQGLVQAGEGALLLGEAAPLQVNLGLGLALDLDVQPFQAGDPVALRRHPVQHELLPGDLDLQGLGEALAFLVDLVVHQAPGVGAHRVLQLVLQGGDLRAQVIEIGLQGQPVHRALELGHGALAAGEVAALCGDLLQDELAHAQVVGALQGRLQGGDAVRGVGEQVRQDLLAGDAPLAGAGALLELQQQAVELLVL